MSDAPLVSVVIPTRDRPAALAMAVRSALAQTVDSLEVLVVDDGSREPAAVALAGCADPRVRVVRHRSSRGTAAARNTGIGEARGQWIAFLDDDDLWAPSKLAAQLTALDEEPGARWCCAGAARVGAALDVHGWHRPRCHGAVLRDVLRANVIPGSASSVLADAALPAEVGGFDPTLEASADWDLWIRFAARAPLAIVDAPLVAYRISPGGESSAEGKEERANALIRRRHRALAAAAGTEPDLVDETRYRARQDLASGRRVSAARRFGALALRRPWFAAWAAGALVVPADWERWWTALSERWTAPGWRPAAESWLASWR